MVISVHLKSAGWNGEHAARVTVIMIHLLYVVAACRQGFVAIYSTKSIEGVFYL